MNTRHASLRAQSRGSEVDVGGEEAVRVVDLLDDKYRRLGQVEVWPTDSGDDAGVVGVTDGSC